MNEMTIPSSTSLGPIADSHSAASSSSTARLNSVMELQSISNEAPVSAEVVRIRETTPAENRPHSLAVWRSASMAAIQLVRAQETALAETRPLTLEEQGNAVGVELEERDLTHLATQEGTGSRISEGDGINSPQGVFGQIRTEISAILEESLTLISEMLENRGKGAAAREKAPCHIERRVIREWDQLGPEEREVGLSCAFVRGTHNGYFHASVGLVEQPGQQDLSKMDNHYWSGYRKGQETFAELGGGSSGELLDRQQNVAPSPQAEGASGLALDGYWNLAA